MTLDGVRLLSEATAVSLSRVPRPALTRSLLQADGFDRRTLKVPASYGGLFKSSFVPAAVQTNIEVSGGRSQASMARARRISGDDLANPR